MRQPYGRAIASTVTYAHPRWYASQGYAVAVQDVRGRGDSTGEFRGFVHEAADGAPSLRADDQQIELASLGQLGNRRGRCADAVHQRRVNALLGKKRADRRQHRFGVLLVERTSLGQVRESSRPMRQWQDAVEVLSQ